MWVYVLHEILLLKTKRSDILKEGKIRVKTLLKFLTVFNSARDKNRILTVEEIMEEIHCCKSNAYNYLRALDKLLSSLIA